MNVNVSPFPVAMPVRTMANHIELIPGKSSFWHIDPALPITPFSGNNGMTSEKPTDRYRPILRLSADAAAATRAVISNRDADTGATRLIGHEVVPKNQVNERILLHVWRSRLSCRP